MPLLDLPNELLLNVAESLREKDLNSFLQTNRRLASLLSPTFYKLAAQDKGKFNALLWAADRGHLRLVDLLLRNGADISVKHNDHQAFEAIHFAAHNGDLDMISLLLERGSDIAVQDGLRSTPLHWAARRGFLSAVQLLLEKGAPPNDRGTRRMTPLHTVTIYGSSDLLDTMVKNMLDAGADPSIPDHRGATPLHFLLRMGQGGVEAVQMMLERGVDVNTQDKDGLTPLHWVAMIGGWRELGKRWMERYEVAKLLIDHGADPNIADREGITVLDRAAENNVGSVFRPILGKREEPDEILYRPVEDGANP